METRRFGASTVETSVIGFGTWPIGGARYGSSDDRAGIRAIQVALDRGITCFDTAPSYGNGHAEELLGEALGARRSEAVIVTKGGMVWDDKSFILGQDSSKDHLERTLADSLRRLRTDYVDLYLIHWPDSQTELAQVARTLESFIDRGMARAIGVSNFTTVQIRELSDAMTAHRIAASQVGFSLFDQRWAKETFTVCEELEIGVMAYGPLAHGLLTGALSKETEFDPTDWRAAGVIFGQPLLTPENRDRNLAVIEELGRLASSKGCSLPQLAIAWVLHDPQVTVALVGARNEEEITEAAPAAELTLTEDDLKEIERIMEGAAGLSVSLPAGGTSRATTQQGA
jgi:aryl-alcohol dehydrogenase-like predicted oxidoreductase